MRAASCRWLSPLRRRRERIEVARFRCPRPLPFARIICGGGGAITTSGSSSSNEVWERPERGRLLERKTKRKKIFVPTCSVICGTTPVDVKNNSGSNTKHLGLKARLAGEKTEKTGTNP